MVLKKTLQNLWTARRSNQSIPKEINPDYSLKGLMLKLKLQYFGHLMRRADSLEKTLVLGQIEGWRRRDRQRMRWLDDIIDSIDMDLGKMERTRVYHGLPWIGAGDTSLPANAGDTSSIPGLERFHMPRDN